MGEKENFDHKMDYLKFENGKGKNNKERKIKKEIEKKFSMKTRQ